MKIGFDLHGTIDRCPELFKLIMKSYKEDGHEIFIISGSEKEEIIKELTSFDIDDYTDIISVNDFLRNEMNIEGWLEHGNWYCDEDMWWKSKSLICEKYNIDMHIDDSREYRKHFDINHRTRFIFFNDKIEESLKNMNSLCKIRSLAFF